MAKPFSLQPLVQLAKQKNDAAIKNLGKLNQQQQSAQDKLVMLNQFRRDYQLQFQEVVSRGISPVDMRNFQDFIYRLDQAIEQQQRVVEHSTNSVNAGREELMGTQRKMRSFDTLAQRHLEAEQKLEAKAEQKLMDEFAGQFAANRLSEKINEEIEQNNRSES